MDIDFKYLQHLLKEVNELRENFKYSEISVSDYDEITYIANKNDTRIGVQQGLRQVLECNRRKLREKNSIRKGTLNYCKLYKKEDKLVRVESYVKGRVDVVFIAYYKEDKRFLFPFSSIGGFYPTYSYVTHFKNEIVDEEYYAERLQIVYERYQYSNDNTVDYDYINYAPEGTYPLLSRANGKFILNPELQYYGNCYSTWDEDKTLG